MRNRKLARALSDEQRLQLVARATASADSRGVLWTLLLDTISYAFIIYQLRTPAIRRSIIALAERLGPLADWLTTTACRDDVTALMAFRSPQIADKVALAATCLDVALAESLVTSDYHCHLMLSNPHVPQEVLDRVLASSFNRLRARRGWSQSLNGVIFNLHSLALDHRTFPSLSMVRQFIPWLPDLSLRLEPAQLIQLEQLMAAAGAHHARSGSLDADTLAVFLGCQNKELRLLALDWLAVMPVPGSGA